MSEQVASPDARGPSRRSAVAWSIAFSYAGQVVAMVKGVVLVPLYLRHFTLDTYGAWLASANVIAILGLMELGLSTVFYQQLGHAYGANDGRKFARLVGAGSTAMLVVVPSLVLVAWGLAPWVPSLVNAPQSAHGPLVTTFILFSLASALNLALTNAIGITSAWQRTTIGGSARLVGQVVELVSVLLLLTRGRGLVALGIGAVAGAVSSCVLVVVAIAILWRRTELPRPSVDAATIWEVVSAGAPIAVSRVAILVASNIEIALIAALLSPGQAAIYGITERMFRLALGFVNPIGGSVLSALAHFVGSKGMSAARPVLAELSTIWSAVVAIGFPVLLLSNRSFVGLWVGADKYGGIALSAAICANTVVSARVFLSAAMLWSLGELRGTAWSTLIEPLVRLPMMLLSLHWLGPIGLPLAALGTGSLLAFVAFPYLLRKRAGLGGWEGLRVQFAGSSGLVVALIAGLGGAIVLPPARTWVGLAVIATAAALALGISALAASPPIRAVAAGRLHILRQRLR